MKKEKKKEDAGDVMSEKLRADDFNLFHVLLLSLLRHERRWISGRGPNFSSGKT